MNKLLVAAIRQKLSTCIYWCDFYRGGGAYS